MTSLSTPSADTARPAEEKREVVALLRRQAIARLLTGAAHDGGVRGDLHIRTSAARNVAAACELLLPVTDNPQRAQGGCVDNGMSLLRCGNLFGAIHIPSRIVYAEAGATDLDDVTPLLSEMLEGGTALVHPRGTASDLLTVASASRRWCANGAKASARSAFLGVPLLFHTKAYPDLYGHWMTPVNGTFWRAEDVAALVGTKRDLVRVGGEADDA